MAVRDPEAEHGWPGMDDDEDYDQCTVCMGEIWVECDDPIQCTYERCDGIMHPDPACLGTGLAKHQVMW